MCGCSALSHALCTCWLHEGDRRRLGRVVLSQVRLHVDRRVITDVADGEHRFARPSGAMVRHAGWQFACESHSVPWRYRGTRLGLTTLDVRDQLDEDLDRFGVCAVGARGGPAWPKFKPASDLLRPVSAATAPGASAECSDAPTWAASALIKRAVRPSGSHQPGLDVAGPLHHCRQVCQGIAVAALGGGVGDGGVEDCLVDAEGDGGQVGSAVQEAGGRSEVEAVTFGTEPVGYGNAAVVEGDLAGAETVQAR